MPITITPRIQADYQTYQSRRGTQSLETYAAIALEYGLDTVYAGVVSEGPSTVDILIQQYNKRYPNVTLPRPITPPIISPVENPGGGGATTQPNTGDTGGSCVDDGRYNSIAMNGEVTVQAGFYDGFSCANGAGQLRSIRGRLYMYCLSRNESEWPITLDHAFVNPIGKLNCGPTSRPQPNPTTPTTTQPQPQEQLCCDKLSIVADGIVKALNVINETLNKRYNNICDDVEKCTDKIIAAIDKKYKGIQKTCKQCQYEIQNGLGGTLEYAITCAGKCCETCEKECENPPCPPKPEPKKEYVGYCDPQSGLVYILDVDSGPPTVTSVLVTSGSDVDAVRLATNAACLAKQYPPQPTKKEPPEQKPYPSTGSLICSVDQFINESLLNQWIDPSIGIGLSAAIVSTIDVAEVAAMNGVQQYIPGYSLVAAGFAAAKLPITIAQVAADSIGSALGCSKPEWANVFRTLASLSYVESKTGVDLSDQKLPFTYALNGMCQHKQLNERDALAAYMSNFVSKDTFGKLWKIAGYCPDAIAAAEHIGQTRPIPIQLAAMRRRLMIDPQEYHKGMRQLGYLSSDNNDNLFKLTEALPTLQDIIRFMVRDADDETIVAKFGMDSQFNDKFGKKLQQWAQWQGVPDDVARYAWRSHWTIPSPGQLFEFYHRLRYNEQFGKPGELLEDITAALIQQDILPHWIGAYLEVSFHPLTRVDARRGFELGSMDEKQLRASFLDQGYSDDNADILVTYGKRRRVIVASEHKAIKLWASFLIDRTEAYARMTKDGLPGDVVNEALDNGQAKFKTGEVAAAFARNDLNRGQFIDKLVLFGVKDDYANKIADVLAYKITSTRSLKEFEAGRISKENAMIGSTAEGMAIETSVILADEIESKVDNDLAILCQKGVKRRYVLGELTADESKTELINHGIEISRVNKLLAAWDCEKQSIGKAIPTNRLCEWLERGVITVADFVRRLQNIGYTKDDANRIVQDCLISVDAKRAKLADKQAKAVAAAAAKAAAAANRAINQAQRQAKAAASATVAAQKANKLRGKQLVAAAEKVVKNCGEELYDALALVKRERDRVMADYPLSLDDTLQILLLAAENYDCDVTTTYHDAVELVASAFEPDAVSST